MSLVNPEMGITLSNPPNIDFMSWQGQARGYGSITQFCPLPFWGQYFHMVTIANPMDRISSTRYQMKGINRIFPLIPQNPILVK